MAYNTGFPETYTNGYPQNNFPQYGYQYGGGYQGNSNGQLYNMNYQNMQSQQPSQQLSSGIIWVQGEAGAKAYPLAPNNKVLLMDSENPVLYVKSVNANGIPDPLCIYDLIQRNENLKSVQVESVDESRLQKIEERLSKIENKLHQNTNNNKQQRGMKDNG